MICPTPCSTLAIAFLLLSQFVHAIPTLQSDKLSSLQLSKRSCDANKDDAVGVAKRLQDHWWNSGKGYYTDNVHWTDANAFETLLNLATLTNDKAWSKISLEDGDTSIGRYKDKVDDAGWGALLYIRAWDYVGPKGDPVWKNQAVELYNFMSEQSDDKCGGGVYWDSSKSFKNTISNALYLHVSAALARRIPDEKKYLDSAKKTWDFLKNSGLRDTDGIFVDGIHTGNNNCKPTDKAKWTYSQGVIASGLGVLSTLGDDKSMLDDANSIIDSVIKGMTQDGILKERCDDTKKSTCNTDQTDFKGIFMKHLMYYLDQNPGKVGSYKDFISKQSTAIKQTATNKDNDPANVWYAKAEGDGAIYDARTVASGIDVYIAAARYSDCDKAAPGFAAGNCGVHVTQYQKADPAKDHYKLDITIRDANSQIIGRVTGKESAKGMVVNVSSKLPNLLLVNANDVDKDPVDFKYGAQTWNSNDQSHHCNFGAYDSGKREGDCGFQCDPPKAQTNPDSSSATDDQNSSAAVAAGKQNLEVSGTPSDVMGSSLKKYADIIVGLLAGNVFVGLVLVGIGCCYYIRRPSKSSRYTRLKDNDYHD